MNARRLIVLLTPWLIVGCGGDDKPLTPTEFSTRYAQEICAAVSPACLIPEASCVAQQLSVRAGADQDAINQGRSFMPSVAQTCLNQISSVYGQLQGGKVALKAGDLHKMNEDCRGVYRGRKLVNEACGADEDCATGLICDSGKVVGSGRCGAKKVVSQGGGCANIGEVCPPGSYCGSATGVPVCQNKLELGLSCGESAPCLETLRCSGGTCVAQLGYGDPCAVDQDCASGFCEPYAHKCADDVRFADRTPACLAMAGTEP
jgi:hypothetical protein